MITSISVGSKVIFNDGSEGTLTAVIVDRTSRSITHIAIQEKSIFRGEERLVPLDRVTRTTRDTSTSTARLISCKNGSIHRTHYLEIDQGTQDMPIALLIW